MTLEVEKSKCFELPEGIYKARFDENKPVTKFKDGKLQNFCRLVFEVIDGPSAGLYAGRNFLPSLSKNSQLREFLEGWLGPGAFTLTTGRRFNLDDLVGREADILVRHIVNSEDIPPFRQLAAIYPAGTYTANALAA